ncbi:MAG TPA: MFS transporter [Clostridia bacterium]|nr:MFS transporter [Clostridia bacterium]
MRNPFASPLWSNTAFVRLWSAATISIFGSLITRMAIPFVAILVLDAGPLEVSILRGMELGSALIVGLVAGAWVDRLRRRPVLIWSDLGRAAVLATIPIAFVFDVLTIWQLLAVSAIASVLTTFFDAADNAYLPTVVERDRLVDANAALAASGSAAEFSAFGLSGFLISALSAPIAIVVDAVTFIVSAVLLRGIRKVEDPPPPRSEREPVRREIAEGLRLVVQDPVLRAFAGAQMMLAMLWGVFGATWILFATEDLGLGPAPIGVIAAIGGFASFIGAVAATRSTRRWGIGPVAIGALVLAAIGNAFIPLAPSGLPLVALACLLVQQLVGDSALTVYDITETTVRQTLVADRQLGRVTSTFHVSAVAAQLVATIGAGLIAEAIGVRATTVLAPLGAVVAVAILWISPVRALIALPVTGRAADARLAVAEATAESSRNEPFGG